MHCPRLGVVEEVEIIKVLQRNVGPFDMEQVTLHHTDDLVSADSAGETLVAEPATRKNLQFDAELDPSSM